MTLEHRRAVTEALEAAGWTGTAGRLGHLLKHPSGAVWEITTEAGGCDLDVPDAATVTFSSRVPNPVVIAACLAAAGQLDPAHVTDLEERAAWLASLEAAGLDNWPGVDVAREIHNRT
ncbi:hypothetical protein [Streptomyces sp. H27-H5]|uniref:hypothetical protein n=1 Tax=Streptomyces sp. H27-H5 TaxID=2996460 RepID=UPI00226DEF5B|nr:hypothetical protein [Streptomyces sp. H27-H5]MCY0957673.1 hypothetical protein [Streptomyces sp. H27-H5]